MPFTDPMADGPAIQAANLRSLGAGTHHRRHPRDRRDFRERHPARPAGADGLCQPDAPARAGLVRRRASPDAGVDGVICVDIPPEEDDSLGPALRGHGLHLIRLATPTTDAARLPAVLNGASGFLYYVSVAGITGLQQAAQASIEEAVARLKAATDLPVAVGFGVRTPEQAAAIARVADGVVVGSAIVELVGQHGGDAAGAGPRLYPVPLGGDRRAAQGSRMSWLTSVRNALAYVTARSGGNSPDNLWHKCKGCGQMVFVKELEENLYVCPQLRPSRADRRRRGASTICSTSGSVRRPRQAQGAPRTRSSSAIPKRYADRIKAARAETGEPDALINAHRHDRGPPRGGRGAGFRLHGRIDGPGGGRGVRRRGRGRDRRRALPTSSSPQPAARGCRRASSA